MDPSSVSSSETVRLAIRGARLIDGVRATTRVSSTVLIGADGRIAAVGPSDSVHVPVGVPEVSADGLTLLPGLIDGHVHLTWDKTLYSAYSSRDYTTRLRLRDPERQLVRAGHFAQMALAAGVTTVRDCGADDFSVLTLRDAIQADQFVGPRILACGRPITTTAGHIYSDWGVDSRDDLRKAVRALAAKNVDFIKLIVSGGTTTPGTNISQSQYSLDDLEAVVADAHRLGLPVVGHAISTDSIRLAAAAGLDTIEHCSWIGEDPKTTVTDPGAVESMISKNVRVDHAIIPRPYLFPDEDGGSPNPEEQWWLNMLKVRWPFLHTMRARGVTVFLGTDAAFGPWPGTERWPGFQELARAIEVLVRWAEFPAMQAIQLATHEAACALGLGGEIGAVEVGKRADLMLVAGDPLADIRALRHAAMVFRDGRLVAADGRIVLPGATT
jgi:imidazolonepropionase-like amidohydrolase